MVLPTDRNLECSRCTSTRQRHHRVPRGRGHRVQARGHPAARHHVAGPAARGHPRPVPAAGARRLAGVVRHLLQRVRRRATGGCGPVLAAGSLRVRGPATRRSSSTARRLDGRSQRVSPASTTATDGDFSFGLTLKPFGDGGWYWFEIWPGNNIEVLEAAYWPADGALERADRAPPRWASRRSTGSTPASGAGQLGDDIDVLKVLDDVVVVDQGTERIERRARLRRGRSRPWAASCG